MTEDGRRENGLLTTGDMARLSANTLRTVRFYEESGILQPVERTEGGHRLFSPSELDKLRLVSDLRSAGFGLEEIKQLLAVKGGAANGADAAQDLRAQIDVSITTLSERIVLLQRLRDELVNTRDRLAQCTECRDND